VELDGPGRHGRAVGDDAGRQADLRRSWWTPYRAGRGPTRDAVLANPIYQQAVQRGWAGSPGVHGDGEAARAAPGRGATTCWCWTTPPSRNAAGLSWRRPGACSRLSSTRASLQFFPGVGPDGAWASWGRGNRAGVLGAQARHRGVDLLRGPVRVLQLLRARWPTASPSAPGAWEALLADSATNRPAGDLAAADVDRGGRAGSPADLREEDLPFGGHRGQPGSAPPLGVRPSSQLERSLADALDPALAAKVAPDGWPRSRRCSARDAANMEELRRVLRRRPDDSPCPSWATTCNEPGRATRV